MEDIANPFKSIAPTSPIPVELDHVILVNSVPPNNATIVVVNI